MSFCQPQEKGEAVGKYRKAKRTGHEEDNGAGSNTVGPVPGDGHALENIAGGGGVTGELDLEAKTRRPDEAVEEQDEGAASESTVAAAEGQSVGDETDHDGANDGTQTGQDSDESTSTAVEQSSGDGTLVGVD